MPIKLRQSRVLSKLRQGGFPTVIKLNLSDPRVVELAGMSGVDAVWICNEHVPNDWLSLEGMIRAARLHDIDSIVRVARGSYSDYVKPFEADATAIMVPHVASAADARQVVDWVRFHPVGRRALDGGNVDGAFCQIPLGDYLEHANKERFVMFQIESPEALENVEEIAAVPGFDMLVFGPGDFSHRIGKPGQVNAPEVVAARKRVAAAAQRHGKFAMGLLIAPVPELVAEGHRLFTVGADVVGVGNYFKDRLEAVQKQLKDTPAPAKPATSSIYG